MLGTHLHYINILTLFTLLSCIQGCYDLVVDFLESKLLIIGGSALGFAFIQVRILAIPLESSQPLYKNFLKFAIEGVCDSYEMNK